MNRRGQIKTVRIRLISAILVPSEMPKIVGIFKAFFDSGRLNLSMIASRFVFKTMILLFSIPLISQSGVGIEVDFKPLQQFISSKQVQPIDTQQVKLAVDSLAATAQINAGIVQAQEQASYQTASAPPDAQFAAIMQNLQKLTEQAQ